MNGAEAGIYGAMLIAGLAGSLHCVGMCGPLLVAFSRTFDAAAIPGGPRRRALDLACYHAGRLWTYGVLGFMAGLAGTGLRSGATLLDLQRGASVLLAAGVIAGGLALSGLLPATWGRLLVEGCGLERLRERRWFSVLLGGPGLLSRFLLGVTLGLLPCGLVYAMLVAVAALPGPLHAALAMIVFGAGTLPALTAVLVASRIVPARLRRHGTRLAAATLIVAGGVMLARAFAVAPACHAAQVRGETIHAGGE